MDETLAECLDRINAFYSSRNKADVGLIQLEDIVDAQNEIRVKKVMES